MKTTVIQIGNSDDRLGQAEWAQFVTGVQAAIECHTRVIHFAGTSGGDKPWQNACWVFELADSRIEDLSRELIRLAINYRQDEIAWTVGRTAMISAKDMP